MIDLHVHLTLPGDGRPAHLFYRDHTHEQLLFVAQGNALAALRAGVTTLRDCGGRASLVLGLRNAIREGLSLGPRLFVAGPPMTITGGHAHYMGGEVDNAGEIRKMSRTLVKQGVDFLKMMGSGGGTPGTESHRVTFSVDELRVACAEARLAGMRLAVHATNRDATRVVAEAAVDTIEHAAFNTLEGDTSFDPRLADLIFENGCIVSPTLQTSVGDVRRLEAKAAAGSLTEAEEKQLLGWRARTEFKSRHCAQLMEHGVPIACSTDAGWRINRFGDFADGLNLMVGAGIPAREAFRSATEIPARTLGKGDELGRLRPGAFGDAVVLRADPTERIDAVRGVVAVYLGGRDVTSAGT
jgi:imidazolonepropionase-like amidohydrolase